MLLFVTLFYCLSILYPICCALFIDDYCSLSDGTRGQCKHVHNCPSAVMGLKNKMSPHTCGFDGFIPIVCCRKSNMSTPTPTPTPKPEEDLAYGKVSSQKCDNYAGLVFQNHSSPTLLPGVLYEIEDTCAIKKENYQSSAVLGREFPHLVSLGYDSNAGQVWKCSGGLISEQFVLTAASCANLQGLGSAKYVRVGSTSARENFYHEKPLQYFRVQEFIKHPKFNRITIANNIALVKLSAPAKFTSIVRPACLAVNKNKPREAINAGWGTLSNNRYMNNEPQKNLIKIADSTKCSSMMSYEFCVEDIPGTLWQNCLIDTGSVLQVYNDDNYCTYDIIGVLSAWDDCYLNNPGIYTNISTFIPWIEKTVWES